MLSSGLPLYKQELSEFWNIPEEGAIIIAVMELETALSRLVGPLLHDCQ
jgi:hypothetical protein